MTFQIVDNTMTNIQKISPSKIVDFLLLKLWKYADCITKYKLIMII
jgi:hypothetical protein